MKQCKYNLTPKYRKTKLEKLVDMCESPIEIIFLESIYNKLGNKWKIEPQVKIDNFRVDFLISSKSGKMIDRYTKGLVIECNGKEFHSEVEKCRKDQLRANYLNLIGYRVFPFRGKAIYNDMDEIIRFIKWYLTTELKPDPCMSPADMRNLDFWNGREEFVLSDILL